ncbi:hypothetical protein D3C81_1811090 [compost metagenome]
MHDANALHRHPFAGKPLVITPLHRHVFDAEFEFRVGQLSGGIRHHIQRLRFVAAGRKLRGIALGFGQGLRERPGLGLNR